MRVSRIATAPSSIMRLWPSIVTTYLARMIQSAGSAAAASPASSAATTRRLYKRRIEGPGENALYRKRFLLSRQVNKNQFRISGKLPQNLAAGATRRGEGAGIGGDCHPLQLARAFRHSFEHSDAFGAHGQTIGSVFDIAAGKYAAVLVFERGSDFETRIRRVRALASSEGSFNQRVW